MLKRSLVALVLVGCAEHHDRVGDPWESAIVDPRKLDLLFVIDDSGSMAEEQASLAMNFPLFIEQLESLPGGLPDVHIGVISSDMGAGDYELCLVGGDAGTLQSTPRDDACSGPEGAFIKAEIRDDGTRATNFSGELTDVFACIAQLGTLGCGFEQHLGSMKAALDGSNPLNDGFLREDAYLAVVFIADEDDCTASDPTVYDPSNEALGPRESYRCTLHGVACGGEPIPRLPAGSPPVAYEDCGPANDARIDHPAAYVDFLKSLKPGSDAVIVAAIVGDPDPFVIGVEEDFNGLPRETLLPSCESGAGVALPAVRFRWVVEQFPDRSALTSICDEDLSGAVSYVGGEVRRVLGEAEPPADEGGGDGGGCAVGGGRGASTAWVVLLVALACLGRRRRHFGREQAGPSAS